MVLFFGGSPGPYAPSVKLDSCEALISENTFSNNSANVGAGLICQYGSYHILNNRFDNNHAVVNATAALATYASIAEIYRNTFIDNSAPAGAAGALLAGSWIHVHNNIFQGNSASYGAALAIGPVDSILIRNNLFYQNSSTECTFGSGSAIAISSQTAQCVITRNQFYMNTTDIAGIVSIRNGSTLVDSNLFIANQGRTETCIYLGRANGVPVNSTLRQNVFLANMPLTNTVEHQSHLFAEEECTLYVESCDFIDNVDYIATRNAFHRGVFFLSDNHWGHPTGPYHQTLNPEGRGDTCTVTMDPTPWLAHPVNTGGLRVSELFPTAPTTFTGDTSVVQFYVRNSSEEPRSVTEVLSDSLFVQSGEDLPAEIAPGDSLPLELRFIPTREGLHEGTIHVLPSDTLAAPIRLWFTGEGELSDLGEGAGPEPPARFVLSSPWPNPANQQVKLALTIPSERSVRIVLRNILGRQVHTQDLGRYPPGEHTLSLPLDGVATGVYFLEVRTGEVRLPPQRIVLLR